MTENQGLVETTFGVRRVAVHAQLDATRLNWILGQASNKSCDVDELRLDIGTTTTSNNLAYQ